MKVKIQNVDFSVDKKQIIQDINMFIEKKKFVGIIGPNGSGKSTLLKCIYNVQKTSGGNIYLNEKKINDYKVKDCAKMISVVSQHNYYNFDFKIEEVVLMGRAPHKKLMEQDNQNDYDIVNDALEKVGMTQFKGRSFSTLSGGEQQRIILARALAQQTPCIVLDEPTNHLDIKYQLQLLDIVKGLDVTVISAIHDLNIATMYCDYLYAMKDGKIAYQGSVEQVVTKENILDLYEVNADVSKDKLNRINITYYPKHLEME